MSLRMVNGVWTDDYTGRPAYNGPNGEPGYAAPGPGTVAYTMPDGRVAYYVPGNTTYADPNRPNAVLTPTGANAQIVNTMKSWLAQTGLSSLSSYVEDLVVQGYTDPNAIQAAIEQTSQWRERFGVVVAQRDAQARGEPVQPLSPAEVVQREQDFASLARYYGLPASMYDSYTDFQGLIIRGVTPQVFEQAAMQSFQKLQQAPPEVRNVFGQWFGPQGDAMLAAYFMDPEHVTSNLPRITNAALAGGYAQTYGFDLGQDQALKMADMGISDPKQLGQGFSDIQAKSDLFRETATEHQDLTAGIEGVQSAFNLPGGGAATETMRNRVAARQAAFGGGGGAVTSQRGVTGIGGSE